MPRHAAASRVGFLTPVPLHRMPPFMMFCVDGLRERLADEGFELQICVSHAVELRRPENVLERLRGEVSAAAWVLFRSSEPVQRWFAGHSQPCVVAGSCFPQCLLPSIDLDYRAICRHGAGFFRTKGHRRMALLLPNGGAAGDKASAAGFLEGSRRASADGEGIVLQHNETVADVCRKVDGLLGGPQPVTALLVARAGYALTVLTHLQRRGLRLPEDVALISRDDDTAFDFVTPSIARYTCNPMTFARRLSRIVLQLARERSAPPRQTLLMPEFLRGATAG